MNYTRERLIEVIYKACLSDKLCLNEREAKTLERRINGDTLEAISKELGVQKERTRQIEAKGIRKLCGQIRNWGIK